MKPKTFIATLIALLMLVAPCAALIGAGEAYAAEEDEQDEGLSVGDAWGISITANSMEELIEKIEELFDSDSDPEDSTGDESSADVPEEPDTNEESDLTGEFLTLLMSNLDVDAELILSGIIEVTKADPERTGYTISLDAGLYMMINSTIDIELKTLYEGIEAFIKEIDPEYMYIAESNSDSDSEDQDNSELDGIIEFYEGFRYLFGDGKLFVSGEIAVAALLKGVIKLDTEGVLTSVDLAIDISGKISLETNIDISATMTDDSEELTEEDAESSFVKYLGPDAENDVYSITLGGSLTYRLYNISDGLDELFSGSNLMTASMYADFEVPAALHDQMSEFMDDLIYELDLPEDYEYQFEDKFQLSLMDGFMESFDDLELDDVFLDLDYLEMDKESDMFLNIKEKSDIRSDLKKAENRFKGMVSTFEFDVKFLDEEGEVDEKLSMKVSHGERIKLPILDKNDENEKFVGWRTALGGLEWNPVWGVKGNLTLEPIYIEVSDDLEAAFTNLKLIGARDAYITLTLEELEDLTELEFDFLGTLYVDVVDADGNVLYSWSINSSGDKIGKITNFKVESDNTKLNDEVRKHIGNGKSMYLNFSSSGPTPGLTTVKYNVSGVYEDGTELDVYFVHEDEEGKVIDVELVGTAMVSNGMVAFNANHFSGYVLWINEYTITIQDGITVMDGDTEVLNGTLVTSGTELIVSADPKTGYASVVSADDEAVVDETHTVVGDVSFTVVHTVKPVDEYVGDFIENEVAPRIGISKVAAGELTNVDFEKLGDKTLVIDVVEDGLTLYSWTFEGEYDPTNEGIFKASIFDVKDIDENLTNAIESAKVKNSLVLKFSAEGKLPKNTTVKYYVGDDFEEGTALALFFYNEDINTLERVESDYPITVDGEGYVSFSPSHFSQYVLAELDFESGGIGSNTLLYVGVGIAVAIIALIAVVAIRRL